MATPLANRISVLASACSSDPREAPRSAREAGFNGLLCDVVSNSLDLTALSGSGRREFLRLLSQQDQPLVGLQLQLGRYGLAPGADVERELRRIETALELAAEMKAGVMCIDLGSLPRARSVARPKARITPEQAGLLIIPTSSVPTQTAEVLPPPDPTFVSQVDYAMKEIAQQADRFGVVIAFSSALASFSSLEPVLLAAGCPWFGVDLDPTAVLRDELSRDDIFSLLGNMIRHVRGKDGIGGEDRRTRPAPLGQGNVGWPALLAALDDAGYGGTITIDPTDLPDRAASAAAGVKFLKSLDRD